MEFDGEIGPLDLCLLRNYIHSMKTALIPIGNSRGLRIPKPFIQQCGLEGEVEMDVRNGQIVISSVRKPRQGWERSFKMMARLGDDALLDADAPPTKWDEAEWQWK